jgi:hypothetical protein
MLGRLSDNSGEVHQSSLTDVLDRILDKGRYRGLGKELGGRHRSDHAGGAHCLDRNLASNMLPVVRTVPWVGGPQQESTR